MPKKKKGGSKKKGGAKKVVEEPGLVRQLCNAAAGGDVDEVTRIFDLPIHEKKFDLTATASECVWKAAEKGHTKAVKVILDHGCDVNANYGKAIQKAAEYGHAETVMLLASRGADINMKSTFAEWTALHYAAKNGHLAVTDMLVRHGAVVGLETHPEQNGTYSGWTALHFAADGGHLSICQFLVDVGKCLIDALSATQETPLAIAAEHGRFEVVRFLVTAGANIHATRRGLNVVQWAIYRCDVETVQFLVSYGAKANMDVRTLWFPSDMSLAETIKAELSEAVYKQMDLAIYRGSVSLQTRAAHMRALSEIQWAEGTLYDAYSNEPKQASGLTFDFASNHKHVLHLISAYEI